MNVYKIVNLHKCPVCFDFPRPYVPVENCTVMHMICGVCYSQLSTRRKKHCVICNQPYKKYPNIPGYHAPLEFVQIQYIYNCINKEMGCKKQLTFANVQDHDKRCEFYPYRCPKKNCGFLFPFFSVTIQTHKHLRVLYSNDNCDWNFELPLLYLYSVTFTRVRLSKNVPRVVLLRGSANSFDVLFRPILFFRVDLTGAFIQIAITWYCKEIFSLFDVSKFDFLITAYVKTSAGNLKRANVVKAFYLSDYPSLNLSIEADFFSVLYKAFKVAKCVECNYPYPHLHFNVKIINLLGPVPCPDTAATIRVIEQTDV